MRPLIKLHHRAAKITSQAENIKKQHDSIYQLERSVCEKTVEIKEQRTKMDEAIETLDMKLTIAADIINEELMK
jgi:hypothetical protein